MMSRICLYLCILIAVVVGARGQNGACESFEANIVFAVQSSVASDGDLDAYVQFLNGVISSIRAESNTVNVGLVTYGDTSGKVFNLIQNSYERKTDLGQLENPTINQVLSTVKTMFNTFASRTMGRDVVVFITNQTSGNPDDVKMAVDSIRGDNFVIYVVGVGDSVQEEELQLIASAPSSRFLTKVDSLQSLVSLSDDFSVDLCEAFLIESQTSAANLICESFMADVVFAVDQSTSVRTVNFNKTKEFIGKIIESMSIGDDAVRVGLFTFSSSINEEFGLGQFSTKEAVLNAVNAIPYEGGLTYTNDALRFLNNMFSVEANRPNVTDIVILLSDGKSTEPAETMTALGEILKENYTIFTLGIGTKIDKDELNAISSNPDSTYSIVVDDFDDLKGITDAFTTQICEETFEPSCEEEQADIVLVVDSSGSIGRSNFNKVKTFLIDLVKEFKVSVDGVRVGLMGFAAEPRVEFYLDTYLSKGPVLAGISSMEYTKGKTYTDKALEKLRDMFDGNGNRPDVEDIVIFVSDGKSTEPDRTMEEVEKLKKANLTVFSIGIGDKVDTDELDSISSQPDEYFTSLVSDFDDLDKILSSFTQKTCEVKPPPVRRTCGADQADIVLVVDTSGSIGGDNFEKVRKFLLDIVQQFDISEDGVRVALVGFATEATVEFNLKDFPTKELVLSGIQNMNYTEGGTHTDKAIKTLREVFEGAGSRPDVNKIAVLLTDGKSSDSDDTKEEAEKLQRENYFVFSIGVGENVDFDELYSISSDPDDYFTSVLDSFDDLNKILDSFSEKTCEVAENPRPTEEVAEQTTPTAEVAPQTCAADQADIVIVVDTSGSIGDDNFEKVRKFLLDIVQQFDISEDGVRVALVGFATETTVEFNLKDFPTKELVLSGIQNMIYTKGGTHTEKALKTLREVFEGAGSRPDVNKIAVLLTDGKPADSNDTKEEAEKLQRENYFVFAIGVGDDASVYELNSISSDPDDYFTSLLDEFDDLDKILDSFSEKTCEVAEKPRPTEEAPQTCAADQADIVIVVDTSGSIGNDNFEKVRKFLLDIVQQFDISEDGVRVALVGFATEATVEFNLKDFPTKELVLSGIQNMTYTEGGTHTDKAIKTLREVFEGAGSRPDVNKIAVLLTDGKSSDSDDTKEEAEKLQRENYFVFTIGVGDDVNVDELNSISSDPDDYFTSLLDGFDDLDKILDSFAQKACEVPSVTLETTLSPVQCSSVADILIIMDASSSIGSGDFFKMRNFVKDLINSFEVGPDSIQISFVVFNNQEYVEFLLNTFSTAREMLDAIDASHLVSRGTYTHLALQAAREVVFQEKNGKRERIPSIAIVLTDGKSTQATMTEAEATKLKNLGVTVLAVGIGSSVDVQELEIIASEPLDTTVQRVANFDDLTSTLQQLVNLACLVAEQPIPTEEVTVDPPEDECQAKGDLVLLVDISTSIGASGLGKVKGLLKDVIQQIRISESEIHVALVTYDILPRVLHRLDDDQSVDEIVDSIEKISNLGYGSWADRAFRLVRMEILQNSGGDRPDANDLVILVTDGLYRDAEETILEAEKLRENGVKIITIGTDGYNEMSLRALSSAPSDEFSFTVEDFDGIKTLQDLLTDKRCPRISNCGLEADIVVVMDSSTSIEKEEFAEMKEFVKHLLSGFEIGPDHVRVGLVTFNYDAIMEFQLKSFATKRQVLHAVDKISARGSDTRTDKALKIVREVMFSEDNGNRPDVPDIVILVTDGRSRDREATIKEAEEAKGEGLQIFSIGVGSRISEDELYAIASSPAEKFVYMVKDFKGLAAIESSLQRRACGMMPSNIGEGLRIQADIMFAFEGCEHFSESYFEKAIEMASHLVKSFRVSKKWARIGAMKFCSDVVMEMTLDSYFNRTDILLALKQIERSGKEARVEKALRQLRTFAFKDCLGGRPNVPDIAVIFTVSSVTHVDAARYEALLTRNSGVKIFVIGIGNHVDKFELEIISSTPYSNTVFVGETKAELSEVFNQILHELNSGSNLCY